MSVLMVSYHEAKPSAINLTNLNIKSYPKNMSPCYDFITYFSVDKMQIFERLSLFLMWDFTVRVIDQSERGKSIYLFDTV